MSLLPPTYEPSQRTQLLISPPPDSVQFQKGFLGAQGERAAIEGELQIKGAEHGQWETATISLETIESTHQQSVEISSYVLVLFSTQASSSSSSPSNTIPSTLPFSIPLTPDTPQCIHTPHSSITHRLVATLHPHDRAAQPLTRSLSVHTRRYTSPNRPLLLPRPEVVTLDDPVLIKVEVPRTTFRIGEPIAVYVTIPPPQASVVTTRGIMLRNVMAELVRVVTLGESYLVPGESDTPQPTGNSAHNDSFVPVQDEKSEPVIFSQDSSNIVSSDGFHTTLTRSGASCRFHTSRAVQIRLLLYPYQNALRTTNDESRTHDQIEGENTDCASITQSTLLHRVTFHLAIKTTFLHPRTHSESVALTQIPIILLPNPAPLPELDESFASDYRKKHDRPPARTVRHQDADLLENEAGPSALSAGGAPPPFEERDAPPPFSSETQSSTSSRLPTFLESESEHIPFSMDEQPSEALPLGSRPFIVIPGEGTAFGFVPSDQYDGISFSLDRVSTPPPTMSNAELDTDVTEFANLVQPDLNIGLDHPASEGAPGPPLDHPHPPPPPPPLLDDPSDPPPSIDVEEFRRAPASREQSPPRPSLNPTVNQDISVDTMPQSAPMANAPPPYLHPRENDVQPEEIVTRPPPYVDVLPGGESSR